ncbi:hypothetical protein ATANTOWER_023177 [Ataeniobius toweri]|uniref:Uncharacterized protein n=1 Tax=Ataeniobius toweri TaxID=208326 RepID=A0ABU7AT35_9TELE|nr:hypothetical protein [Ataeniobius toweri]
MLNRSATWVPHCYDIIEANFYSTKLADFNGLDVLDLHFYFRHSLHHRMPDGIHWDALAHRRISSLLLKHVADAWGIKLYDDLQQASQRWLGTTSNCASLVLPTTSSSLRFKNYIKNFSRDIVVITTGSAALHWMGSRFLHQSQLLKTQGRRVHYLDRCC